MPHSHLLDGPTTSGSNSGHDSSRRGAAAGAATAGPLVVTTDEQLLDEALTAVAAAGAEAMVAPDVASALASWRAASIVLVGVDQATGLLAHRSLPARPVHLLGDRHDHAELCELSAKLAAAVVVLPEQRSSLTAAVRDRWAASGRGRIVTVRAASGGLGASTLVCGLGWRAHDTGCRTVLVDLDPVAGGLDLALGIEAEPGWRWPHLSTVTGEISDLADRLPHLEGLPVLSAGRERPIEHPGVQTVVDVLASSQSEHELVVVDLGRGAAGPVAHEVLHRSATALLLVRDDVRGVAAAAAELAGDDVTDWQPLLCRGPVSGLPADAVSETLGRDLAGTIPYDRSVRTALVRAEPPGPGAGRGWRKLVNRILDDVLDRTERP